jgi:AraC family transcriptional regulator
MARAKRLQKIQPALAYAATHLEEDVSLAALAGQTRLSAFHLQRVFAETVGESPKQLTLRLRLERAAALLLTASDSVLDVALACGFQNHETFSRAFRRRFGTSPSAYREHGFNGPVNRGQAQEHAARVAQVGPCVGLFHIQDEEEPRRNDMEYSISKKQLSAQPVLVMRRRVKRSEIAQALGEIFGRVYPFTQAKGIALAGPPFARYLDWGPGLTTIEAGMPVAAPASGEGDVVAETLPGGPAATTMHSGPYDTLGEAHAAVQMWIEAQGLAASGAPWESYVTDPGNFPDPKDWKTEVVWPLKA